MYVLRSTYIFICTICIIYLYVHIYRCMYIFGVVHTALKIELTGNRFQNLVR